MLTVAEKGHWRDRIAKRIDQRIETLVAKQDPMLLQRVTEQARAKAYASLGIESQQREFEELQKQKEQIERRERRLRAEQRSVINGTPVEAELERGGLVPVRRPGHRGHLRDRLPARAGLPRHGQAQGRGVRGEPSSPARRRASATMLSWM